MKCPKCSAETEVLSTRYGDTRTRQCRGCGHRFMTLETLVKAMLPHGVTRSDGVLFGSAAAAAKASGVHPKRLRRAIECGRECAGFRWTYTGRRAEEQRA